MTMETKRLLETDVPSEYVSERKGLSYVTGRYVKQRLNEIFGWDGWGYVLISERLLSIDEDSVRWFAHVRLTVATSDGVMSMNRDGIAVGHGTLKDRYGKALSPGRMNEVIDFAAAEAVTDALKRAAVSLGQNLGLSLYPMTSDSEGHKTFDAAPADEGIRVADDVSGFATRIGASESLEELATVGRDIATAGLTQPKKEILKTLYQTAQRRLEKKNA
jgi:hypothetical protein